MKYFIFMLDIQVDLFRERYLFIFVFTEFVEIYYILLIYNILYSNNNDDALSTL